MSPSPRGGVLLVDKPVGPTSHDLVRTVRRLLATRAVGHCGTLDPLASGLLVLVVGQATRLAAHASDADKRYTCTARLGVRSDTDDSEGALRQGSSTAGIDAARLARALDGLRGTQQQVPPAYSAVHVEGERAHARARRGEAVVLPPRTVEIHALELTGRDGDRIELAMRVSKGTYVRALVRDLGEALGCGAVVEALRRTGSGHLDLARALAPEALEQGDPWQHVLPPAELLEPARRLQVSAEVAGQLWRSSRSAWAGSAPDGPAPWLAHTADDVVGMVQRDGAQGLRLVRGFPPAGS